MRKKLLTLFAISCFGSYSVAQTPIAAEMTDGQSLIEAYVSPLGNSLGAEFLLRERF